MLIIIFTLSNLRIRGVNLFEYFVSRDHMTETEAAACISQSVSALCYLHQSNIAHLDIKVCVCVCMCVCVCC